ncbi:MAG: hypothetical protein EBZ77_07085 [Chitinophagia bacterium]|nr:hypothetical protein [Chitinophagia bacterium]
MLLIVRVLYTCFLLLAATLAQAQLPMNNPVSASDTLLQQSVAFYSQYLAAFRPGVFPRFSQYWRPEDAQAYRVPDRMVLAIDNEVPTYLMGKPTILFARPHKGYVHIKTLFSHTDSTGHTLVFAITNHYVGYNATKQQYYLIDPVSLDTSLRTTQVRNITYYHPATHAFNKSRADSLIQRVKALEADWQLPALPIRYFFTDTREELDRLRGFDYSIAAGNREKPTGSSDGLDNVVYCAGWGEQYFHEVVHVYLNRLQPASPLNEGLAVWYGGSLGHSLAWHTHRLQQYLATHPAQQLDEPTSFYYLDNYTNPYYTLLGLLCWKGYREGGVTRLRQLQRYNTLPELLQREYNVPSGGTGAWLRQLVQQADSTFSASGE